MRVLQSLLALACSSLRDEEMSSALILASETLVLLADGCRLGGEAQEVPSGADGPGRAAPRVCAFLRCRRPPALFPCLEAGVALVLMICLRYMMSIR